MTRPIFEPSYARTDARLGWGQAQLFRRPARTNPGTAIYEIKVFPDDIALAVGDDKFVWEIPEDLDQAAVVKVEAYISVAGSSDTTIQIRAGDPCTTGADILSTPITIDSGECNSKDASVQPVVIDPTVVSWGDHLHIDVDAAGIDTMGLGVIVTLAPAALAAVVLAGATGPQGAPGGIVNWLGQWSSVTNYVTNDAVSNNGSSYVAINNNTNVEPGVTGGWQTDWMVLADQGTAGASGAWANYTPALTASVSNPTLGTGSTAAGRYYQNGTFVQAFVQITFGSSGVAAGSGTYYVSVPANFGASALAYTRVGTIEIYDSSAGIVRQGLCTRDASNNRLYMDVDTGSNVQFVDNATPWTWSTFDQIHLNFVYESV